MSNEINVECGAVVDIAAVSDLYQKLNDVLAQEGPIGLDASAIERIDTAALQMFVCFMQEAKSRHRTVHWKQPTEALLRSANYLGLKQVLQLDGQS